MMMTNKGVDTIYEKVQEIFTALDFSSNRFAGAIPESTGNIKVLRLLNLSNNILTGHIPPTLGNLAKLESLDLSQNKLIGEISQQLTQLTFLGVYHKENNIIHFKTVHLKEIQNCVETHCQRNVSFMRLYHLYLQPRKRVKIRGRHFNLVGELLRLAMDVDYLLG